MRTDLLFRLIELDDSNDDVNSVIWVKLVIKINYDYISNCKYKTVIAYNDVYSHTPSQALVTILVACNGDIQTFLLVVLL